MWWLGFGYRVSQADDASQPLQSYNDLMLRSTRLCFVPLASMLVAGTSVWRATSASQPLELTPEWTVNLKDLGSKSPHRGYFGVPYGPGSVSNVACGKALVAVTINDSVVFFNLDTGSVAGTKNLSSSPAPTPYAGGFARIFSVGDGRFLVDLNELAYGKEARRKLVLLDGTGIVIHSLDFSSTRGFPPKVGFTVSTTGDSFLLSRSDSGEKQFQLRDSDTFAVRQSWSAENGSPNWQSLNDNILLSIQNYPQPLGPGNRAGKEEPIEIASPGTEPHRLSDVLSGGAGVLADDRILVIHVNELSADLVDDSGRVLRTYNVPFSAPHLYLRLASLARDGRYFAAHFLGQKNFFLPGREYLYLWSVDQSEPIASIKFKWDRYYESESAFCSGDDKLAVVENGKVEMFALPLAGHQ